MHRNAYNMKDGQNKPTGKKKKKDSEIKNVVAEMKKPMKQKRKSRNSPESGTKRLRYRKEERYKE